MDDDYSPTTALLVAAADGDRSAWNEIVDRYSPFLVNLVRQYRLTAAETEDVVQGVWLRLVEQLGTLRDARALAWWIVTTVHRDAARELPTAPDSIVDGEAVRAWRDQLLLVGLAELGDPDRRLLLLLLKNPPLTAAEISRRTGIPVDAIDLARGRAIERLRGTPSMRAWAAGGVGPARPGSGRTGWTP